MASPDPSALFIGAPVLLFSVWLWRYAARVRRQRDAAIQRRGGAAREFRGKLLLLDLNWTTGIALGLVLCGAGSLGLYRDHQEARRAERLRKLVASCTDHSLTLENQNDETLALTIPEVRAGIAALYDDSGMKLVVPNAVKLTLAPGERHELHWTAAEPSIRLSLFDAGVKTVRAYVSARDERGEEVAFGSIYCEPH